MSTEHILQSKTQSIRIPLGMFGPSFSLAVSRLTSSGVCFPLQLYMSLGKVVEAVELRPCDDAYGSAM